MSAAIYFRNIADVIADDLVNVACEAAAGRLEAGTLKRAVLSNCYQNVQRMLALAIEAVRHPGPEIRSEVKVVAEQVKKLAGELMSQVAKDLTAADSKDLGTVRKQTIFVDGLRQISSLAKGIAESMTREEVIDS